MSIDYQRTINRIIEFEGIGLHTGKQSRVRLVPADAGTGILFIRRDVTPNVVIPGLNRYVVDTRLSTTLGKDSVTLSTIEHLMSAVWGLGIDNLIIEVRGPEIPIMDGSSLLFAKKIRKTGISELSTPRKYFVIKKPISITEGDRYCYLLPYPVPKLSCSIEFPHPVIKKQTFKLTLTDENYYKKISRARTFGFLKEVEHLRKQGLIAGGSLDNAIVLDDKTVLNEGGLRYKDEFVRHKILDTIGDVALMGLRIVGHFIGHKSGHALHAKIIQKALIEECGEIVGASSELELQEILQAFQPLTSAASA